MSKKPESVYLCDDLKLASSLLALGLTIQSVDRTNPRRAVFHFREGAKAAKLAALYVNRELQLDAKTLFDRFEDVRTIVRWPEGMRG